MIMSQAAAVQRLGTSPSQTCPYSSSISSSASSSSSSVFSVDAPSHLSSSSSTASSSIPIGWESDEWSLRNRVQNAANVVNQGGFGSVTRASTFPLCQPPACRAPTERVVLPPLTTDVPLPAEQRQHPRRSSTSIHHRPPPPLVRQCERKLTFVDSLVDSATQMVEVIWPLSVPSSRCEPTSGRGVLPLRVFIQETLRRSRTSYSTLQVALYYLVLIKAHVPTHDFTMEQPEDMQSLRALQCGRRMFLSALILASKYLQDRNYSAQAWSKISGLKVAEINMNELAFLDAVNWKLHITDPIWERWQEIVLRQAPSNQPPSPGACLPNSWRAIMPLLTPELDILDILGSGPRTPISPTFSEVKRELPSYNLPAPLPLPDISNSPISVVQNHYKVPRYLEPKPDLLPPTPGLVRMGPLPTPILTPQSIPSITPAASVMGLGSRRPSMCTAMAQAQSSSLARSCVDQFNPGIRNGLEAYHFPTRRPSLAPSTNSTSSSPESMIMDNSSRSSRASSISSVSSAGWVSNQAKLARVAACRSARLPYPVLSKCKEVSEYTPSEPMSSPDLESFHIDDVEAVTPSKPIAVPKQKSRKRGRSSADLQRNVRHLLDNSRSMSYMGTDQIVLPDRSVAQTFVLSGAGDRTPCPSAGPKALQSPACAGPERRYPIQKDLGRKRTCCGSEAVYPGSRMGPGRWEGVL